MAKRKSIYDGLYTLRSDGRYMGYYRDQSGKRKPVYGKTEEEVYNKIQKKLEELAAPQVITFRVIAESWHDKNWDDYDDGTQSSYKAFYDRALDRFGDWTATDVQPSDILEHLEDLQKEKMSKRSVKAQRTIYSLIYKEAMRTKDYEKVVTSNPAARCGLPKNLPAPKKRESPEDEIITKIEDHAETAYFGQFAYFICGTGFRLGEGLARQWQDLDHNRKRIKCDDQVNNHTSQGKIKDPKTDAGKRETVLLPPIEEMLMRMKPADAKPTDYIFCAEDPAKPLTPSRYRKKWLHWCKDMGFVKIKSQEPRVSVTGRKYTYTKYEPAVTAHDLRHYFVTMCFEWGVDVYTCAECAGHKNVSVTEGIYTTLRNNQRRRSIKKLMDGTRTSIAAHPDPDVDVVNSAVKNL